MTPADTPTTPAPRGITRQDVFAVLGALGAIVTLTTAVMFYFGWQRSDVQARYMGIDVSLFGFSSQDYVLRSISALYLPILVVIGLVAFSTWVHGQMVHFLAADRSGAAVHRGTVQRWAQRVARTALAVAAASVAFAVAAGMTSPPPGLRLLADLLTQRQWVVPLLLLVSTVVAV